MASAGLCSFRMCFPGRVTPACRGRCSRGPARQPRAGFPAHGADRRRASSTPPPGGRARGGACDAREAKDPSPDSVGTLRARAPQLVGARVLPISRGLEGGGGPRRGNTFSGRLTPKCLYSETDGGPPLLFKFRASPEAPRTPLPARSLCSVHLRCSGAAAGHRVRGRPGSALAGGGSERCGGWEPASGER